MQKLWQKKPELKYSDDVYDIVQFGSSVLERRDYNDIDIAVIFNRIAIKDQLNQSQDIKKQLSKLVEKPIHIHSFDLYSLFDISNFSRTGILFYGKSLIDGKSFSEKMGISPKLQISYSLKKINKTEKVKFNYLLSGKGGKYGLLRKYGGSLISPGIIEILPENERLFADKIKEITNDFKIDKIFFITE